VRDTLQVKGYQTIEAGTGEEGVQLAREQERCSCRNEQGSDHSLSPKPRGGAKGIR
jgi:hypothetical protein